MFTAWKLEAASSSVLPEPCDAAHRRLATRCLFAERCSVEHRAAAVPDLKGARLSQSAATIDWLGRVAKWVLRFTCPQPISSVYRACLPSSLRPVLFALCSHPPKNPPPFFNPPILPHRHSPTPIQYLYFFISRTNTIRNKNNKSTSAS